MGEVKVMPDKETMRKLGALDIKLEMKRRRIKKLMAAPADTSPHEATRLKSKTGPTYQMSNEERKARKERLKRIRRIRLEALKGV